MANSIAVKGCTFQLLTASAFQATVQSLPETTLKVCGKAPYAGTMTVQLTGVQTEVVTNGDGQGVAIITGTAKTLLNDKSAIVEGDKVEGVVISGHAGESSVTDTVTVEILDAGQQFIKVT